MDTPERAAELVSIIECNAGEPDAIVRALAPIYRQAEEAKDSCREILWYMIRAAFNVSAAHRLALDEYLVAIERGREPSEEAVALFTSRRNSSGDAIESGAKVIYGSDVLLNGGDGTQLLRIELSDTEQHERFVELQVLDKAGRVVHSLVVRAKDTNADS